VPSSSLDLLFEDLPVVKIKSWDDITSDALTKWLAYFTDKTGAHQKLTNDFWTDRMKGTIRYEAAIVSGNAR